MKLWNNVLFVPNPSNYVPIYPPFTALCILCITWWTNLLWMGDKMWWEREDLCQKISRPKILLCCSFSSPHPLPFFLNLSFSPSDSICLEITNFDSDQITRSCTCCFDSLNNGWRPSMSDKRSGPYSGYIVADLEAMSTQHTGPLDQLYR